ncbi:MAG TPA: extracellular solute-binding protein [Mycobacteriales bacterium]|jgi:multiple sugar transport system substrate-binding protein|nr:extracellular solute-binding protein [Mycobacteriales bacterium]
MSINNSEFSRRSLLRGAGLIGVGATATACGTSVGAGVAGTGIGESSLSYWNLLGGGDGVRMVAMQQGYAKKYPNIDLKSVTLAWGNPYYTKVTLATLGDQPPDVAIAHLTRASILAQSDLLEPLNESELEPFGLTEQNFTPAAWKKAHTNGKLYAIPLDTHPFVMYYNTDVCKKAGLLNKDGTLKDMDGPDALVSAMAAAKKVTGAYGGVAAVSDFATQWRIFSSLYWQQNASVLSDDGRQIVLDDDKAEKALGYLTDLTSKRKLMPTNVDYGGATTLFASGKAGFYFEGDWEVTTFITSKTPFSMTRFPNVFGGRYAVQADSHSFVLPKDSKRDSAKRKVIFQFIRSMMDQSATWAAGGHIPAWLPFQKSPDYDKIKPQSDYKGVADFAHYDDAGWYSGSGSDFENITGSAIGAVSAGQLSPAAAVAEMRTKLTRYAKTPTPV